MEGVCVGGGGGVPNTLVKGCLVAELDERTFQPERFSYFTVFADKTAGEGGGAQTDIKGVLM